MCRRVFNKTIILLGLAGYEMIITNSALRASLVMYIISYPARPRRIIVKYSKVCLLTYYVTDVILITIIMAPVF